jgi:hypothetical protein
VARDEMEVDVKQGETEEESEKRIRERTEAEKFTDPLAKGQGR